MPEADAIQVLVVDDYPAALRLLEEHVATGGLQPRWLTVLVRNRRRHRSPPRTVAHACMTICWPVGHSPLTVSRARRAPARST